MSSLTKRFALWGLPNSSKTTFLGTLLHVLNNEHPTRPANAAGAYAEHLHQPQHD
jgi:hypothetical protein